jgi:hypothetical protein
LRGRRTDTLRKSDPGINAHEVVPVLPAPVICAH